MPLNFVEQKKRQKYLIVISIAILLIAGIIIWFGYFNQASVNPFANNSDEQIVQTDNLLNITIDFSVFENSLLKKLEPFVQIPVYDGKIGRDNPFKK